MDNLNALTFHIMNLDPCTDYEVQVATNCGGGTTDYTAVEEFITFGCGSCTDETFCASSGDNSQEYIANVTVDVLSSTSTGGPNGYEDFTNMSVDLQRGQTYNVSFTPDYPGTTWIEHFRVWIDLNQNGSFNAAERLFDDDQGTETTVTGVITIPLTAELGSSRMRVSMAYGGQFGGDYPLDFM